VNKLSYLLLSDSYDFTTDYIAIELEKRGLKYLRIDRDRLADEKVFWDIKNNLLQIDRNNNTFRILTDEVKGVYYRAPTYLRETFSRSISPEDQLKRSQWMSFYRNLMCIDQAVWINSPLATFHAENKIIQLHTAKQLGFHIPKTFILNNARKLPCGNKYIVKSIDTALLHYGNQEAFVYTNNVTRKELINSDLSLAPVIIQKRLSPKIDFRVTVIGTKVYTVKILLDNHGVEGDWRKFKGDVSFVPARLPSSVEAKCIKIVQKLGLTYGAIDLAISDNAFYFIEINPTGEWAWLVDSANQRIYETICDYLEK
jgi:glutathione synthase/RimK-type ligase-like ATP-grasp enzyme